MSGNRLGTGIAVVSKRVTLPALVVLSFKKEKITDNLKLYSVLKLEGKWRAWCMFQHKVLNNGCVLWSRRWS